MRGCAVKLLSQSCLAGLWLIAAAWLCANATAADTDNTFAQNAGAFLKKHCLDCHGADTREFGLRYDQLTGYQPADRHLWTIVHEQVASGAMPPPEQPRPSAAERTAFLEWIVTQQRAQPEGGTRRMNRRELAAALRDVTGLTVDYSYGLPDDGKVEGFDTGAAALQDAADSVAEVMRVTRRAVEGLRFLEPSHGKIIKADVREAKDVRKVFDPWKNDGITPGETGDVVTKPGTGWLLKPKWLGDRGGFQIRLPAPENRGGILRLRFVVAAYKSVAGVPNPHLWIDVGNRELAQLEISNPTDQPRTLEYQVQLSDINIEPKGLSIRLCTRVEMPYAVAGFENEEKTKPGETIPGGTGLWRPLFDQKTTPPAEQPVPFVVLQEFEIETDYQAAWPPSDWKLNLPEITADRASAAKLLAVWCERAWRRPVAAAELERYLRLYDQLAKEGKSFDEALRPALQSALMSGSFRYLNSPAVAGDQAAYALASRLSFMLWGTPPDQELLGLAQTGKLRDTKTLQAQVARLLADPRSSGFTRPFVSSWLELGQPITLAMEHLQKQDFRFGRHLKASLQDESISYVAQMLADNRPASELLASDWTMMNNITARHYGYAGIDGAQMRRVALRADDPRGGGILAQAGIQSMLCWMGDNWVIYRGAWTLRRLLDDPPPAPPLEVPELLPSDSKNHGKTFRELLKQHQEDSKCAVCHKTMDPLGFAFQNFDLGGRWREREFDKYNRSELDGKVAWVGAGKDRPVDAAGQLPRGEAFKDFAECRTLLVKHYTDDLVRGLLKNLVLYSTGRRADVEDLADIRRIMAAQKSRGYPLRELVTALVMSPIFSK
jgi:mono/diheme cytochrome c family protein